MDRLNALDFLLTGENSQPIKITDDGATVSGNALRGMSLQEKLERMKEMATELIEDGLLTDEEIRAAQAARDSHPVREESLGATP